MATHPSEPLLVLWDIDHTLIETRGVGTKLYRQAFEAVTGRPVEHDVEVTGRTEQAIIAEALQLHGIEASEELVGRYGDELARQYREHAGELLDCGRALPGAAEALAALAEVPGVVQTVLTGNLRGVAVIKLLVFGLDEHIDFEVGAYGEDDPERAKLVAISQGRAGAKHGVEFTRENTVIVGDTVGDVIAAQEGGALIVAVATGKDSQAELRRAGALVALPDLVNKAQVVAMVTRRPWSG
jgi:phosphoglycolate phosphatase-like HAD superfamily hydrolase